MGGCAVGGGGESGKELMVVGWREVQDAIDGLSIIEHKALLLKSIVIIWIIDE